MVILFELTYLTFMCQSDLLVLISIQLDEQIWVLAPRSLDSEKLFDFFRLVVKKIYVQYTHKIN